MNDPAKASERDTRYNGWTNYETWAVKLWIDNDEGEYHRWTEDAEEALSRDSEPMEYEATTGPMSSYGPGDRAKLRLADTLKLAYEAAAPDLGASMWADLLNAAMSEVNWYEIAEALIETAQEARA